MTNPNPTPLVVRQFIAKLLGWTHLAINGKDQLLGRSPEGYAKWGVNASLTTVPNWPGSHDAARGLEVRDKPRFALCLFEIVFRQKNSDDPTLMVTGEVGQLLFATSDQWCLAWILSEHGYKWVECETCIDGKQKCSDCDSRGHTSHYPEQPDCATCHGDGGEFVRV